MATLTKIDLVEHATGNRETLLIKVGTSSTAFTIEQTGRYAFEIAPQDESAWMIEISPLGLPSQQD